MICSKQHKPVSAMFQIQVNLWSWFSLVFVVALPWLGSVTPHKDGVVGHREDGKNLWVKIR